MLLECELLSGFLVGICLTLLQERNSETRKGRQDGRGELVYCTQFYVNILENFNFGSFNPPYYICDNVHRLLGCIWEMHTIRWIELNEKHNKTRSKCTGEDVYNEMYRTRDI